MQESQSLSVSQALQVAKNQLEGFTLRIVGEVSGYKGVGNYAGVYFSLTDKDSTLNCLVWRSIFESLDIELYDGMLVEAVGKFNVFPKKGTLSFSISHMQPAGEGLLRAAVAERLAKLQREGLTDSSLKKPLPEFPEKIGVVTSPQGKVIHDVIRTLDRRYPVAEVLFFGTKVEGVDAPESIAHALDVADAAGCDVILLVRGGGSYEDLLPFSSEEVAYSIARAQTPIVSGVGHEPDVTIADYMADVRASTPTGAAELVSPSSAELVGLLNSYRMSCARALKTQLNQQRHRLAVLEARNVLSDPRYLLSVPAQNIDHLKRRLDAALPQLLVRNNHQYSVLRSRMVSVGKSMLTKSEYQVARGASRLEDLSPLKILTRGYAAVFDEKGKVISSVDNVAIDEAIDVKLLDGTLKCKVSTIEKSGGLS